MVELTDSQKILLQPIAAALGCAADPIAIQEEINARDIRLARLVQVVERHAQGLLGEIGRTRDDVISWYLKQAEKMRQEQKNKV